MTPIVKKPQRSGEKSGRYSYNCQSLDLITFRRRLRDNSSLSGLSSDYIKGLSATQQSVLTVDQMVELMCGICSEYLENFLENISSILSRQVKVLAEAIEIIKQEQIQSKLSKIIRSSDCSMQTLIDSFELLCIDMLNEAYFNVRGRRDQTFYFYLGGRFKINNLELPPTAQARRLFSIFLQFIRRDDYELARTLSEFNSEHAYSIARLMRAGQYKSNILPDDMRLSDAADTMSVSPFDHCVG